MIVYKVCKKEECDNKRYEANIKGGKKMFCCEKGFKKSLDQFTSSFKK
ncbi:hypothetical protein [Chryseobacterium sp. Leaf180]|nr:hypothetical protein [Chryseobacterium sp. Leaf180]